MWIELAKNGDLVPGLAISLFTIYTFVEARILRRRRQYAILKNLYEEISYFLALAASLDNRALQTKKVYEKELQGSFPAPAADEDTLPQDAEHFRDGWSNAPTTWSATRFLKMLKS